MTKESSSWLLLILRAEKCPPRWHYWSISARLSLDLFQILEDHFLSLFNSCFSCGGFNFGNFFPFEENTFFYCFLNIQVMIYLLSLRIILYPCLTLVFPVGRFNFGNYFTFGENTFFTVSWISRSWFIYYSWGPFSLLV